MVLVALLSGCTGMTAARRAALETDAQPALVALQAAKFEDARREADAALQRNQDNARAAGIKAIALYREAAGKLTTDVLTLVASATASVLLRGDLVNRDFLAFAFDGAEKRLSEVDAALQLAQADPGFSLELCPACWAVDWNRSGELDDFDTHLLEVELDADGKHLPEGDPRRRPTFRFDVADVSWLRAMVHFQRAGLALLSAYDPNATWRARNQDTLLLKVTSPEKLQLARTLALQGLAHAETCRTLVLAETDDDREWLPNPAQKQHALPLPVDAALFETWSGVLRDVRALLDGTEGLEVQRLGKLLDSRWKDETPGFIDLGAFFTQPKDLSISRADLRLLERDVPGGWSEFLGKLLGPAYKARMTPSPLPQRLERMEAEVKRGDETFARKLKYLLWLN